jgi:hypothetical protein
VVNDELLENNAHATDGEVEDAVAPKLIAPAVCCRQKDHMPESENTPRLVVPKLHTRPPDATSETATNSTVCVAVSASDVAIELAVPSKSMTLRPFSERVPVVGLAVVLAVA